jgi:hypothetical protein
VATTVAHRIAGYFSHFRVFELEVTKMGAVFEKTPLRTRVEGFPSSAIAESTIGWQLANKI